MSNLRDRLKKISAQRAQEPPPEPVPRARCACRERSFAAPALALEPETLALMGGEEFSHLRLAPEDWIFVDTETTGLSGGVGTVAFEVGVGEIVEGEMRVTQLWMRDYDEEEDLLACLGARFAGKKAVVTFNGKSFDLPLLASRCTLHRLRAPWADLPHLDLVHPARRLYKLRVRQCTLSRLEETVLGLHREGDIPGAQIPGLWAEYLRTRSEEKLLRVFDHNAQDVASMALLLRALYDAHAQPVRQAHMEDLFSVGRVYDRAGRADVAEQCYTRVAAGSCRVQAGQALHRIYRRAQRVEEARALLESMIAADIGGVFPYVELAKLHEHRLGDAQRALHYTDLALARSVDPEEIRALTHRRARLARRLQRKA